MKEYAVKIAANDTTVLHATGIMLRVFSATAPFRLVSRKPDATLQMRSGQKIRLPERFEILELVNNSGTDISAVIHVGDGDLDDSNFTGTLTGGSITPTTPATLVDYPDDSIAAGATEQVLATNPNRREAIIGNLEANTVTVRVGTSAAGAARGIQIAPGQAIILETTASVHVFNPHSAAQSVSVAETVN